jgi:hypothetical protein
VLGTLGADPADQAGLKARAQAPRPLDDAEGRLAGRWRHRLRLSIGFQVQQQQRAF